MLVKIDYYQDSSIDAVASAQTQNLSAPKYWYTRPIELEALVTQKHMSFCIVSEHCQK